MRKLITILLLFLTVPALAQENAIKFTFLGWITGSTKISYERAFGSEDCPQSGELAVGWIGAGGDKFGNDPEGITVRYGHKFFVGEHSADDPLEGWFIRPEIIGTRYYYDHSTTGNRHLSEMFAVLGTGGYQLTRGHFIADFWVGAGWCTGTPADTGYQHGFKIWDMFGGYNPHIAMSFSIRLGFCF